MKLRTAEGVFTVRALEDASSLGAVPLATARPAIVRELASERRADAYVAWTINQQKSAQSRLVCERDRLPERGVVSLSSFAPFLSMHEAGSATARFAPATASRTDSRRVRAARIALSDLGCAS